jgi:hypothetical protein
MQEKLVLYPFHSIMLGDSVIKPSTTFRNLGAVLDSHLDIEQYVNSISRSCFMKIRQRGRIRKYLTVASTRTLIKLVCDIKTRLLYSLLFRPPMYVLIKLQMFKIRLLVLLPGHRVTAT